MRHARIGTAKKSDGICISLWQKIIRSVDGKPTFDSRSRERDEGNWREKPGHKKRCRHIVEALERYDGFVDVVIVNGIPGESYGDAHAWIPSERGHNKWRITSFYAVTGHFSVEAQPFLKGSSDESVDD